MGKKQMHLGVFILGTGHHMAAWRHPEVPADGAEDFHFFKRIASLAEKGKFDLLFLSDGLTFDHLSHPAEQVRLEPITLLSALSAVTERIGLVATASTTYNEPFHIARKFSSINHLSQGRVGWNVVTSYYEKEAENFSKEEHLSHATRYERAHEFVDVVKGLWNSWEEDALIRDKISGKYFAEDKLHALNHQGKHFQVKGPLNSSQAPQGHPVIVQAGSSKAGIKLAGETAEVVFTAQQTLEDGQVFYKKIKAAAEEAGRDPGEIKILPGVTPIIGKNEVEAREKFEQLQDLIVPELGLDFLSDYLGGIDFSQIDLDGPLPEDIPETNGNKSRREIIIDLAKRENLTVRELYKRIAGTRGHRIIFGSPVQIADQLQEWVEKGAADGFNLMFSSLPNMMNEFVQEVVPILQKRGIFRTEYEHETLRGHLNFKKTVGKQKSVHV